MVSITSLLKWGAIACCIGATSWNNTRAELPPPEDLLPPETVFLISIPNWQEASSFLKESPLGKLWRDPALNQLREHVEKKWKDEFLDPLQKELDVELADYAKLLNGQATLAVIPAGGDATAEPSLLLISDAGDAKAELAAKLNELKTKWLAKGQPLNNETIRNVEFFTLIIDDSDVDALFKRAFPSSQAEQSAPEEPAPEQPSEPQITELTVGQVDSALVVTSDKNLLAPLLARFAGAALPSLSEQELYRTDHNALFREAVGYAWLNFTVIYQLAVAEAKKAMGDSSPEENPMQIDPEQLLNALGLGGITSASFTLREQAKGSIMELSISSPEAAREGLVKIFSPERKTAAPPDFVSADVASFWRWRVDAQKGWDSFDQMVQEVSPQLHQFLEFMMSNAGKEKDPSFDLKRNLIGNISDDFITVQQAPSEATLASISNPPTLFLIRSGNPDELALATKVAASLMPTTDPERTIQEREFLGRLIYTVPIVGMPDPNQLQPGPSSWHFAPSASYLAISGDPAMLEAFLRSTSSTAKPLLQVPGLREAAEQIGGMELGMFGYEDQRQTVRSTFEALKKAQKAGANQPALGPDPMAAAQPFFDWLDVSLLPPFERIEKYFHFGVYSGTATPDRLRWRFYAPLPPELR